MLRCCGSCSGKVTNAVLSIDIVSECRLKVLPMSNDEDTACNVAGKGRCHVDRFPSSQADFTQHSNIFSNWDVHIAFTLICFIFICFFSIFFCSRR